MLRDLPLCSSCLPTIRGGGYFQYIAPSHGRFLVIPLLSPPSFHQLQKKWIEEFLRAQIYGHAPDVKRYIHWDFLTRTYIPARDQDYHTNIGKIFCAGNCYQEEVLMWDQCAQ